MKKTGRTLTWVFLALFPAFAISAQVTIRNYSTDITGDFGPRKISEKGISKCDFHRGMDLKGVTGTPFPLIEDGEVKTLGFTELDSEKGIFYIQVKGDKEYRYLHMFSNAAPSMTINSGDFTLTRTVERKVYAIIYWANKKENRAKYIISSIAGQTVKVGDVVVKKETGEEVAVTSNTLKIENNPYIGPIGTSGGFPQHMHVDRGRNVNINPLNYIMHDNATAYEIGLWDKNNKPRDDSWVKKKRCQSLIHELMI